MNLNPDDGHIMGYLTGWDKNADIGNNSVALLQDYLSKEVWNMPVNNVAIVRHQKVREVNIKVFDKKKLFSNQTFWEISFNIVSCSCISFSIFFLCFIGVMDSRGEFRSLKNRQDGYFYKNK